MYLTVTVVIFNYALYFVLVVTLCISTRCNRYYLVVGGRSQLECFQSSSKAETEVASYAITSPLPFDNLTVTRDHLLPAELENGSDHDHDIGTSQLQLAASGPVAPK